MKKILLLMLVLSFALGYGATFRFNTQTAITPADADILGCEDASDSWQTKALTMAALRTYVFSSDITLSGVDLTVIFGTIAGASVDFSGGKINGVTVGASTPSTGAFTTLQASGQTFLPNITPTGAGSYIGTSSSRWASIYGNVLNVTTATIGDVSNTEIQRLDGVDGDLLYLGRGRESTTQGTYTASTSVSQDDEGGHFLKSGSSHSITLPSLETLPIGWEIEFVNTDTGVWTILDNGADSGFANTPNPAVATNVTGTSITIPQTGHVILRSPGTTGKWLIVSTFNCTLVP